MKKDQQLSLRNKTLFRLCRLAGVLCLLAITYTSAKTYYVATTGNNSAAGTLDQPFASLQKGHDVAVAGDTVYIRGGTYTFKGSGANSNCGIYMTKSGSSDTKRIYFWAYPGEIPKFDFAGLTLATTTSAGIRINGSSWLHFKGLEICNVPEPGSASNNGIWANPASNCIFELMNFHHNTGPGLSIAGGTGGNVIINCDSHDNFDPNNGGENSDGFGVHYQETGTSTTFRDCRAWWNGDDGWDFISQEVPVITDNCFAMGSGYSNSGTASGGNGNGFKMGSSKNGIRHVVRNCVAWKNKAAGFYANHSSCGNDWYNNTSYSNGTQYNMLASTWDAAGNRTDGVTLTGTKVHKMKNNIGFPNKNSNMNGVETSYNTWDLNITPAAKDFLSVTDPSMTVNDQTMATLAGVLGPRQADGSLPKTDFLKLVAGSQMIDKGTDIGLPFAGTAPDLGAHEYGATGVTPTGIAVREKTFGVIVKGNQIQFNVPEIGTKRIEIINLQGKMVFSTVTAQTSVTWNRTNAGGSTVSEGGYIARISYQGRCFSRKIVIN